MTNVNNLRGQAAVSHAAGAQSLSPGNWLRAWHDFCDKGQSIVEFAIVLPCLMAVLLVIYEVGIFLLNYQTLTQAVNQGGMALQAGQSPTSGSGSDHCAWVSSAVLGSAGNLQTTGVNGVQLQIQIGSNAAYGPSSATGFSCGSQMTYVQQGAVATVTGTYPCTSFGVSFFASGPLNFFTSGCKMSASVQELMQ